MNIGMANIKFFKQGQIEELVNGDFVQPRLSLIFKENVVQVGVVRATLCHILATPWLIHSISLWFYLISILTLATPIYLTIPSLVLRLPHFFFQLGSLGMRIMHDSHVILSFI